MSYGGEQVSYLLEIPSLNGDILHLAEVDISKEMGCFPLRRQNRFITSLPADCRRLAQDSHLQRNGGVSVVGVIFEPLAAN